MKKIFHSYKFVLQQDMKDCGPACLSMVLRSYGTKVSIAKLRELCGTDEMGTSGNGLMIAARKMGLLAKGLYVEQLEDIFTNPKLPAIAHVVIDNSLEHYVVIHAITEEKLTIADPAKGIIEMKSEEFFSIWTGFIMLLTPSDNFVKNNEMKGTFSHFFELLIPQKKLLLFIFTLSIISTVIGIISSFYFQYLIDSILPNNLVNQLTIVSFAVLILIVTKVLMEWVRNYLMIFLAQRIDELLLLGFYNHVVSLPMKFFQTRKVGEIVSRFNDATNIRDTISSITITIMMDLFMATGGGIILYFINDKLFYLTLIPVSIYLILVVLFKNKIEKNNRMVMEDSAVLTTYLVESLNGIETVKSFKGESVVRSKTKEKLMALLNSIFKFMFINNIQDSLRSFTSGIFNICIIWLGIYLVLIGQVSLGSVLTFQALLLYFLDPIERILSLQPSIQSAVVAAERLSEIFDLEIEKMKDEANKYLDTLNGDIRLDNVSFQYGKRELTLENISFTIKSGERVAFVGESGSGKSTIAKLLMGFYPVEKGNIYFGETNIHNIDMDTLREKIAYISQEIFFFSGSIKENLLLTNHDITDEEIISVCKMVKIHDYINELPLKYHTYLEENASNLSGGQKQRLAIARALLKKPEILILDEATSNLDTIHEKAIIKMINELSKDITIITIAHRLTTIENCDKIYVINNGKMIEFGTHNELLESSTYYSKLFNG